MTCTNRPLMQLQYSLKWYGRHTANSVQLSSPISSNNYTHTMILLFTHVRKPFKAPIYL